MCVWKRALRTQQSWQYTFEICSFRTPSSNLNLDVAVNGLWLETYIEHRRSQRLMNVFKLLLRETFPRESRLPIVAPFQFID